ncbi:MAG TPA: bifunctional ADP-heptose synthase [Saprospiraceae bacterium]|nr:bifunctional ADP-heptose synthase [Saprospiraceae bacterium]HPI09234.1 bifunctional ADP-heptose synthase [Saprospiraceae bacterium]
MSILQQLENHEVLIVGDVMIDRYLTGSVNRISPEAPVPVVLQQSMEDRLGGAANVALNIRALGSVPVLCSVIGRDEAGQHLKNRILPDSGITADGMVFSDSRRTTVKTRILGNNQQMLRIDSEDTADLNEQEQQDLLEKIRELLATRPIRAIILQDYNKGVLTEKVIRAVLSEAHKSGIITAVDPKKANFFAYNGVDLFKPNLKEVRDSLPFTIQPTIESLRQAAGYLREGLKNRLTMITLSEKGLFLDDASQAHLFPTIPRKIADVSGAGDTVISIATLALVAGLPLETIATLSNLAGGQVCEFPGVVPVDRTILAAELEQWK